MIYYFEHHCFTNREELLKCKIKKKNYNLMSVIITCLLHVFSADHFFIIKCCKKKFFFFFSNVFHEIEVNSNRIWNYQMYVLVMEFDTKAALVAPLSIIIHIYLIIKWIFRKTCLKKSKGEFQFELVHSCNGFFLFSSFVF